MSTEHLNPDGVANLQRRLEAIPGVERVTVRPIVQVTTHLKGDEWDEETGTTRENVYAEEQRITNDYPDIHFDFLTGCWTPTRHEDAAAPILRRLRDEQQKRLDLDDDASQLVKGAKEAMAGKDPNRAGWAPGGAGVGESPRSSTETDDNETTPAPMTGDHEYRK